MYFFAVEGSFIFCFKNCLLVHSSCLNFPVFFAECQKPLAMDGFYAKDGAHYCADDYHRLFVSRCRVCGELAEGNVVSVLGDTYHQQCFHCSKCGCVLDSV